MCVISVCGLCCDGEDSVCSAVVMVLWRTSWYLVLLAFILFHSSDDCIEDCISVSPSDGDTIRVGALLECSLLDCFEECTSVSSSGVDTTRVGALLDCSSFELCGSVADTTPLLSSEVDTNNHYFDYVIPSCLNLSLGRERWFHEYHANLKK